MSKILFTACVNPVLVSIGAGIREQWIRFEDSPKKLRQFSEEKVNLQNCLKKYEQLRSKPEMNSTKIEVTKTLKQKRAPRAKPSCFESSITLLTEEPELSPMQFCKKMDSNAEKVKSPTKYRPPESWRVRTF